jgi:hypothetical protein
MARARGSDPTAYGEGGISVSIPVLELIAKTLTTFAATSTTMANRRCGS